MSADFFDFPEGYTPRRGRLLSSGIVLAILGCLNLMSVVMSVFYLVMFKTMMATAQAGEAKELEQLQSFMFKAQFSNVLAMGTIAALFIAVGFGSIFLKRWSRPLALVLSWGWLYTGVVTIVSLILLSGGLRRVFMQAMAESGTPAGGPNPATILELFLAVYIAIFFVFGVMLPGLIVWLNWHQDVRVTLEFCDPKPRWTDGCPVPVLGLSMAFVFGALSCPSAMILQWFPVFGKMHAGSVATIGVALLMGVMLAIAWGCYRKSLWGWGAALLLMLVGGASAFVTLQHFDLVGLFEQLGFPAKEMEEMKKAMQPVQEWLLQSRVLTLLAVVSFLPPLGYLFWVLRFFLPRSGSDGVRTIEAH